MVKPEQISKQYQTSDNLDIRIAIHNRYSTNKQGFNNWIFNQYEFDNGSRILDLGCGTSVMWKDNYHQLPQDYQPTLVDFSEAMIEASQKNLPQLDKLTFLVSDITKLPFEDASFDIVSANMVLFHLPDIHAGLKEIKRVLKPDGRFLAATFGENGISQTLGKWISQLGKTNDSPDGLTLQNGSNLLKHFFEHVERRDYLDSLEVTKISDIVDSLYSLPEVFELEEGQKEAVAELLIQKSQDGILTIPKEYGIFICQ